MISHGDYKLILYPKISKALLYNLKKDPLETRDLSEKAKSKDIMKRLFAMLLKLQKETGDTLDLKEAFPGLT
jgi:hypothetical protein